MKYLNSHWTDDEEKATLYKDYFYLHLKNEKAIGNISRVKMYEAILDYMYENPWFFYLLFSRETLTFIHDLRKKATPLPSYLDPRLNQDDFTLLINYFVFDPDHGFNEDYGPLLDQMDKENPQEIDSALAITTYLKGLLDLYGLVEKSFLLSKLQSVVTGKVDMHQLHYFLSFPIINYFYWIGGKEVYRTLIQHHLTAFKKEREKHADLDYRSYSNTEIMFYANRFYLPPYQKSVQLIQTAMMDSDHVLSYKEDPFATYFDDEYGDKKENDDYDLANENTPKWYLKGHTLGELAAQKLIEDKRIVLIEERDIGPEIFFPFKDTIVGVYNLAKETLNITGDVATGDMPWDNLEKIKAEFYAHREQYLASYIASLGRPLTPYEKDTVEGLKIAIPGNFIFHSLSKEGAVMVDPKTQKRYLVHPLGMGFSEMLQGGVYDELVSTVIVPFEDYLTYDSFISSTHVFVSFPGDLDLDEGKLIRSAKDFVALA